MTTVNFDRSATASHGQTIRFLEQLTGQVVFYIERAHMGMATVVAARHNGFQAMIELRFEGAIDAEESLPREISFGGSLSAFSLYSDRLRMSPGYGIAATLFYQPEAIRWVREQLLQGTSKRDLMRLVRSNHLREYLANTLPTPSPGADHLRYLEDEVPRCLINTNGPLIFVHARNLPGLTERIWTTEYPLEIIIELCDHFNEQVPNLMANLLQRDRRYVIAHPGTMPTIAQSAEALFTQRPSLALFYHLEYGAYSLNAGLSNEAAMRILGWIGESCGFQLQALTTDRAAIPTLEGFNAAWEIDDNGPFEVQVKKRR